jgi:hypothetical protein
LRDIPFRGTEGLLKRRKEGRKEEGKEGRREGI